MLGWFYSFGPEKRQTADKAVYVAGEVDLGLHPYSKCQF